jgi:cytochrome c oxidase assembly protein subunit 15
MISTQRRLVLLKQMATICAVLILTITSVSAFIRLSNVGLGCSPWPQCYGQKLRQAQQGNTTMENSATVGARMLHRVVAVAALLLILIMAIACFSAKPVLWPAGRSSLVLLVLALLLAVLGRWSSGTRVPAVAIGNLLGGFAMLVVCWRLRRQVNAEDFPAATAPEPETIWWRVGLWCGAVLLVCQVALGGLVSASYAGLSCTALPDCGNTAQVSPAQHPTTLLQAFDPWREPAFDPSSPANSAGAVPHMAHRYGAVAACLLLLPFGIAAWRSGKPRQGRILLSLLAIQVGLGTLLIAFSLPLGIALAHNLFAALLLAAMFSLV